MILKKTFLLKLEQELQVPSNEKDGTQEVANYP